MVLLILYIDMIHFVLQGLHSLYVELFVNFAEAVALGRGRWYAHGLSESLLLPEVQSTNTLRQ